MQYQKTGKNTVKPLKQTYTVEVRGSNPRVPTINQLKGYGSNRSPFSMKSLCPLPGSFQVRLKMCLRMKNDEF